jgi:hypothetical protein
VDALHRCAVLNPWLALTFESVKLGLDAHRVIALRMMYFATGDGRERREARRMIIEKAGALVEAQAAAVVGVMKGQESHAIAKKMIGVVGKRVRANKRRLSRR